MSSTNHTTDTRVGAAALTEAEERHRQRDEARLIRTREAEARKDTAARDGQWSSGDRTPLNPVEELKSTANPLRVRERIETMYSRWGFWSIPPADLRQRFKWWGLYTQRRPGIDGGKTAVLDPHQLEDEYFMMRVRSDGGQLSVAQARAIATISREFGRDSADVSDRQNIQMHWIRIEDVPEIFRRLEAVGLDTTEACGDVPRVILGSPIAGVAPDELIDPTPYMREIYDRYIGDPSFSNLPRKFKTAITGLPVPDVAHEVQDVAFTAVDHPELGVGFDLWVGGGLSTTPMLGQRVGAFVAPERVSDVWAGVIGIFRDYGYRRLRTKARLKFLVRDWGIEKFREILETEYLGYALPDGPGPRTEEPGSRRDHIGVHRQRDGKFWIGTAPRVGRISGTILQGIADAAEAAGSDRIRLTPFQKILVLDIPEDRLAPTRAALGALGLEDTPREFRRNTMTCTGIEFCKLAIVETKATAADVVAKLDAALPTLDTPITIHVNGCPNSCARVQVADIGFKGQLVLDDETGKQVPGFQVHLGGRLGKGDDDEFGRKIRGHKVKADGMPEYVERVTRNYLAARTEGESFATWVFRASDQELS